MERFLKIDWNPALDDIIDDVFVNEERLKRESIMYRIMHGCFDNPFKDMEEDYKEVKVDSINEFQDKLRETTNNPETTKFPKCDTSKKRRCTRSKTAAKKRKLRNNTKCAEQAKSK